MTTDFRTLATTRATHVTMNLSMVLSNTDDIFQTKNKRLTMHMVTLKVKRTLLWFKLEGKQNTHTHKKNTHKANHLTSPSPKSLSVIAFNALSTTQGFLRTKQTPPRSTHIQNAPRVWWTEARSTDPRGRDGGKVIKSKAA